MPLSWNEIRSRAITFSRNWSDAERERAEAQTFWNEFFDVFGIRRRVVATFEEPVKNLKGDSQFIDLFWPGKLIAEHKTRGRDLSKAATQAFGYVQNLVNENRRDEAPRYILVSDFAKFALHDLEAEDPAEQTLEFNLRDFHKHIRAFAFVAGYETRRLDPEDDANIKATQLLANVHDRLEAVGYSGHDLQRFMVRILFCLFADDTGIFEPDSFKLFIHNHTRADGSDLGTQLSFLFQVLDTPEDKRSKNLDDDLRVFPYVNGELYRERLVFPVFDAAMRTAIVDCCNFRWEKISPAVFGSLFQSVMDAKERRQIGAHYTSERDILKLIRSLFMDDLRAELDACKAQKKKLEEFHRKLGGLKLLDPACGCGNFLVLAYRELRRLEMDVLQKRLGANPDQGELMAELRLQVGQLYGIEIEEWPVRIAEVALWLMDHQMNQELFARFGGIRASVPLRSSPNIRQDNALRYDWNGLLPANECSYVLGNPPFVGKHLMTIDQQHDMQLIWGNDGGVLDYVTAWYYKACEYMRATSIRAAFVSTNSITQGEQTAVMWGRLFNRYGLKIHFAHRTFCWQSEARGKAHVHVVIVGFGLFNTARKNIWEYQDLDGNNGHSTEANNISPYLIDGPDRAVESRSKPLCSVPSCMYGNKPADGGHLIIEDTVLESFILENPEVKKYIRPLICADEYLNGKTRWCLWLENMPPTLPNRCEGLLARIKSVRIFREASKKKPTQEKAMTPSLFAEIRQPTTRYMVLPRHSSENRAYIPFGYFDPSFIVHDSCTALPGASLYHFGILSSSIHMAWVRQVCGRIKSDYRYSSSLVYNTFPWPAEATASQKNRVEKFAQDVLDVRNQFPNATLADLYDPVTMPPVLAKAHLRLDHAVERCYRSQPFTSDRQRFEYLFALYERLTAPLTTPEKKARKRTI